METKILVYVGFGCLLFITILLILLALRRKTFNYDLDRKPSESLYGKKGASKSGPLGMEYNNNESEDLNNLEFQIIDSSNILEYERDLEKYDDIENDPDKAFMANLCEKMEYDLKEKIKNGHCICFKTPLRTKVIRDHQPSTENSDELNLDENDVVLLTKIFDDGWAFGSRAKGRFREGAFPICCLENRYDLFRLLPNKENYDTNFFNIDRYSSIRTCKNSIYKYYYHPVINVMKQYNNNRKSTILDIDKEVDISNYNGKEYDGVNERNINNDYDNNNDNDNLNYYNGESVIKIPDLPKHPRPLSYEEKLFSLRKSLERRQRKMSNTPNQIIREESNNINDNNYNNNDITNDRTNRNNYY